MKYLKELSSFIIGLISSRKLLITLSKNDFKEQYLGSYLGIIWAVIRPSLFITVLWLVFSMGFKAQPIDDGTPFILWLLCGMIPWFFFAEGMNKGMGAITSNAFLVKKVAFRVSILPLVNIISASYIHIVFMGIVLSIFLMHGYTPTIYWLQIPYFIILTVLLLLGFAWMTSAIRVFVKDIGEVIGIIIQFGFWLTPIFWSIKIIPQQYQFIIKLNPMFYIIDGYRNALINQKWFWEDMALTTYYLGFTVFILITGAMVFKRLRPHFGDVL
jgi:ABC-type polysaccharide/polyol phosphate export permease